MRAVYKTLSKVYCVLVTFADIALRISGLTLITSGRHFDRLLYCGWNWCISRTRLKHAWCQSSKIRGHQERGTSAEWFGLIWHVAAKEAGTVSSRKSIPSLETQLCRTVQSALKRSTRVSYPVSVSFGWESTVMHLTMCVGQLICLCLDVMESDQVSLTNDHSRLLPVVKAPAGFHFSWWHSLAAGTSAVRLIGANSCCHYLPFFILLIV